jgi:hypothetical protein
MELYDKFVRHSKATASMINGVSIAPTDIHFINFKKMEIDEVCLDRCGRIHDFLFSISYNRTCIKSSNKFFRHLIIEEMRKKKKTIFGYIIAEIYYLGVMYGGSRIGNFIASLITQKHYDFNKGFILYRNLSLMGYTEKELNKIDKILSGKFK